MLDAIHKAEQSVADADAILRGVCAVLDGLEDELCKDARYYALLSCLRDAVGKLSDAAEAIEELSD